MPTVVKSHLIWNQKAYDNTIEVIHRRVPVALRFFNKQMKIALGVPGFGSPSRPGQPPRMQTGALRDSVRIRRISISKHEVHFRAMAWKIPYARALEFGYPPRNLAPRPAWIPTFFKNEQKMIDIIIGR